MPCPGALEMCGCGCVTGGEAPCGPGDDAGVQRRGRRAGGPGAPHASTSMTFTSTGCVCLTLQHMHVLFGSLHACKLAGDWWKVIDLLFGIIYLDVHVGEWQCLQIGSDIRGIWAHGR